MLRLKKRFGSAALLIGAVLFAWAGQAFAQPDPRMWEDASRHSRDGIKVREGHHVEWQRTSYRRSDGYVLVVWSDCRLGDRDLYGQLIGPDGHERWAPGGISIVDFPYRQEDPEVVSVNGGWIVAWIDFRFDSTGDVYAQKINDTGAKLWADTSGMVVDTFTCGTPNCGSAVNTTTLRAVSDNSGGAIIAWEDNRRDPTGDILAQHMLSTGTRDWSSPLHVTWEDGAQTGITADGDGNGNMLVAWQDGRNPSNQDIYAAKVTPAGLVPWGANGMVVCSASGSQKSPKLCPDGQGGCYIGWVDQRNPTDDIYMQRINGNGVIQWAANGVVVCDAVNAQEDVRVATSMNGSSADGCVTVWEDQRTNGERKEVYVQKMSPTGSPLWTANGLLVCGNAGIDTTGGPSGQTRDGARLVSDLAGGLITAWEDTRSSDNDLQNCDIYGARVLSNGTLSQNWGGECGEILAGGPHAQNQVLLRVDAGPGVYVYYDDLRVGSQSVNFHHFDIATGALISSGSDSVLVFGLDGDATNPRACEMTRGRVAIIWQDNRSVGGSALYYQIVDSSGHMERTFNGDTLVPDNEGHAEVSQEKQEVCADDGGGVFVTFEDLRTGAKRIRLTHLAGSGELQCSRASEIVWADANTTDQVDAFCAPDGLGGCFVAWSNYNLGYLIDVYVMRMNSDCTPAWAQPARLTNTQDDDIMFKAVTNPDHSVTVVWKSGSFGAFNISTARVRYDGSVAYNFAVCDAADEQDNPTLVADLHGGAYYAWSDKRNSQIRPGFDKDIYGQHLDSTGQELWGGHNGIPIVIDTLLQDMPQLALSNDDQIFCVWENFVAVTDTTSNLDLYAQKLSPNGVRQWPVLGKPLCVAHGDQREAVLFADYGNGLWSAWTDNRVSFPDVYGMHWGPDGTPPPAMTGFWKPDSGGVITGYYQWQNKPTIASDAIGGIYCAWQDQRASGKEPLINVWMQRINDRYTSIRQIQTAALPLKPELYQNYPNPFNPSTRITFAIPSTQRVTVEVFNTLGQRVASLVDRVMVAGKYEVLYDSPRLATGMYYYRLKTPNFIDVKKMLLLK